MAKKEYFVKDAAEKLGISVSAVHKRIERDKLEVTKSEDNRIMVILDDSIDYIQKKDNNNEEKKKKPVKNTAGKDKNSKDDEMYRKLSEKIDELSQEVTWLRNELETTKMEIKDIRERKIWEWVIRNPFNK